MNNNLTDERLEQFAEIAAQHDFFDATIGEVESMVTELRERRQADKNFFMYGIADPDGCAHMDEFCVSSDKGLLEVTADELNLNEGTDGYRVVALYTALPLTDSERDELQQYRKAAMQQEPVAYMTYKGYLLHAGDPKLAEYSEPTPLYDSPPAPVVPDEKLSREIFEKWCVVNIERNKWHPEVYAHLPAREQWDAWEACRAAMLQAGNSPVIPNWHVEAERMAELHGASFVIFRHGEKPVCADPSKFWFGYDPAAPQQEQSNG